jgi:hypothetical protein
LRRAFARRTGPETSVLRKAAGCAEGCDDPHWVISEPAGVWDELRCAEGVESSQALGELRCVVVRFRMRVGGGLRQCGARAALRVGASCAGPLRGGRAPKRVVLRVATSCAEGRGELRRALSELAGVWGELCCAGGEGLSGSRQASGRVALRSYRGR